MADYIQLMLGFVREAGAFALAQQGSITQTFKADKSIVTETDIAISKMFMEKLAALPNAAEHYLIDEEFIGSVSDARAATAHTKYIWVLDPIDGTTPYACGMPLWGVMIALFIDGEPAISALMMPGLGELIYTDGQTVYLQKGDAAAIPITLSTPRPLHRESIVLAQWGGGDFDTTRYAVRDFYSSIISMAYPVLGRASGSFFNNCKLWDAAPALPLAKTLGLTLCDAATGAPVTQLNLDMVKDNWQLQKNYLLCHPSQVEEIRSLLR